MIRLAFLLALVAGPASALSCMVPDPVRTYAERAAEGAAYNVVVGQIDLDPAALPQRRGLNGSDPDARVPARLTGQALGAGGFATPYDRQVTLAASCAGPWCPTLGPARVLAFVRAQGGVIAFGACGGDVFVEPSAEDVARVEACFAGECPPAR